jgi:cysteine synthase
MDISRLEVTYENYDLLLPLLLAMLDQNWLKSVLVEATTGNNTGTRLAFIGAVKGCKVILILPASLTDPAKGY